ncbi:MAG: YqeG family HAD IIIA-type phosphatase [Candidatus Margulisbacteria bacterium]|nr:YqeG family HAD IIIA-type phosphatase [Candidatus Margulisiibacteriota bacterium]MBU1022392.1 YqeG family HAD IIIA-type phosphatase [Candidatus Margulisiibacteriota bacterium]MBU1729056.1 YqeG family HAD IIIA-type phosphatase [Candidatus Margulisiibacteriota bacterium]MBU1954523.1 YqeG family HAD IIIA-type phosphatase [Candidatus Margulisiibacteriota bacterium]
MDFSEVKQESNKFLTNLKEKIKVSVQPKQREKTIYNINLIQLKDKGIKALILDLDDTLLPKTSSDITPKLFEFIEGLKMAGFKVCISSNNRFPKRVAFISRELELPYMSLAFKPLPQPFKKALELLGSKKKETAIIGDQLFTDILGGNLFGIHTIMVMPITGETNLLRQIMRRAEKFFLNLK